MQIGFHSVGLHRRPFNEVCRRAREAGYAAIEVNAERLPWAEPHVTPSTPRSTIEEYVEQCRRSQLSVSSICAHVPLVHVQAEHRRSAIAYVEGCIDLAPTFNTSVVHVLSGPPHDELTQAENWTSFCEAMSSLAGYAQERGIRLAVEAIVGHVCADLGHLQQLSAEIKGLPIYVNFDPSHFIVQGIDPARVIEQVGDRIVHVHMKDGKGRFSQYAFPPLGEGEIDFVDLIRRLRTTGYRGVLSVEYEAQVFGWDCSEEDILRNSLHFVQDALASAVGDGPEKIVSPSRSGRVTDREKPVAPGNNS